VLTRGGERRTREVTGAGGSKRNAAYGVVGAAQDMTAIVEAAEIVGITDPTAWPSTSPRARLSEWAK
jgi:glycerate kinase